MSYVPQIATDADKRNWEVEKLKHEIRNLGRTFRIAVVVAVIIALTTLYNIYGTVTDLETDEKLRSALKKELSDLNGEKDAIKSELNNMRAEIVAIAESTATPDEKSKQIDSLVGKMQLQAPDEVPYTKLPARVYVQYLSSQQERVAPILNELRTYKYAVKELSRGTTSRQRMTYVAYYYDVDKDEAEKITEILRLTKAPDVGPARKIDGSARPPL